MEAKQKPEKGKRTNGVNKEGRDYGEGMAEVLKMKNVGDEKWKKKRFGSHIRSIQDQCLGDMKVWRHVESHMQMFKECAGKQ